MLQYIGPHGESPGPWWICAPAALLWGVSEAASVGHSLFGLSAGDRTVSAINQAWASVLRKATH